MKKTVSIFGAGQAGAMIRTWLPANIGVCCYIDNNQAVQGTMLRGIEVLSADDALKLEPEVIIIAVLNREADEEIRSQLEQKGFRGRVVSAVQIRDMMDLRLSSLRLIAADIIRRNVPGAVAELGVYRGAFAEMINQLLPDRRLYLFDTFEGFPQEDLEVEGRISTPGRGHRDFSDTCEDLVLQRLAFPERVTLVKGRFPESLSRLPDHESLRYAFVSLDPDLYEPVRKGLEYFYPAMSHGGIIMVHDYDSMQFPNVRRAVDEYCAPHGIVPIPLMDLHGTALIVKQ